MQTATKTLTQAKLQKVKTQLSKIPYGVESLAKEFGVSHQFIYQVLKKPGSRLDIIERAVEMIEENKERNAKLANRIKQI